MNEHELQSYLKIRPGETVLGVVEGGKCPLHPLLLPSPADLTEGLGIEGVSGDADPVQPGLQQSNRPPPVQQHTVALEAYPAPGRHQPLCPADELLQARVQERFADPVQDQRLKVGKGRLQRGKGLIGHITFHLGTIPGFLDAHPAAEVAARRGLHEQLRRPGTAGRDFVGSV